MKKLFKDIKEWARILFFLGLFFLFIVAVFAVDYGCWRAQHPDAETWTYGCHCLDDSNSNRSRR